MEEQIEHLMDECTQLRQLRSHVSEQQGVLSIRLLILISGHWQDFYLLVLMVRYV